VSTKNMALPKGLAQKLTPKYVGPYKLLRDYGNNSFLLDLPSRMRSQGIHPVFHSSLLRIHLPNDDRRFPGCLDMQVLHFDDEWEPEWTVSKIRSHSGAGEDAIFKVEWKAGDVTWLPYADISHLDALAEYLDLIGVTNINNLPDGSGTPPSDDPQPLLGQVSLGGIKSGTLPPTLPSHPTTPSSSNQPLNSWFDDSELTLFAMSIAPDDGNLLYFSGQGRNVLISSPDDAEGPYVVTREQLKLFADYSHILRNKSPRARPSAPLGYEFFAHAFNSEGLHSSASYIDDQGMVVSTKAAMELADIVGKEEDAVVSLPTTRMQEVEKMVWHTALSASRQREKMEMCHAGQRKEKNFGRKQVQKLNKKGLGRVRKEADLPTTYGAGSSAITEENIEDEMTIMA